MSDDDAARQLSKELQELMARQEELDPELEPWVDPDGPLGPMLKHPLVYSILHTPGLNALVNAQLKAKTAAVRRARAEREWSRYIYLHERPYRLDAFRSSAASWTAGSIGSYRGTSGPTARTSGRAATSGWPA